MFFFDFAWKFSDVFRLFFDFTRESLRNSAPGRNYWCFLIKCIGCETAALQLYKSFNRIHKDLMQTYNASGMQVLIKLRLSTAMPFIFNGLKICSTLALIGAIVAEFFGSPIKGMGFRISTEVGRFALDMVWAEITMAAIVGSLFYGGIVVIEKVVTFWHPSQRGRA